MAHLRHRYIQPLLKKGLQFKSLVGVFGHRQVGKTTILENLTGLYTTLDLSRELLRAEANPEAFLEELSRNHSQWPIAIDECQMSPALFPALKEFVRMHKKPGAFLLSGSVRFSSRKAIRESLTGRLLAYELLPFSISELMQKPLNTLAKDLMTADFRSFEFTNNKTIVGFQSNKEAQKYLANGGLPGLCFVRSDRDRFDLFDSQINLILDRDLRLVCEVRLPLSRLLNFVKILAENQNQPLNLTLLKKKTGISEATLKKILSGLESIFFIRVLPCKGDEKHPVIFLEDQGEAFHLASGRYDSMADLERIAFAHLRIPFVYEAGTRTDCFQYRKHGGAYVPFVFQQGKTTIGFICGSESKPSLSALKSAQSLKQFYPKVKVVYLHPQRDHHILNSDEVSLPIEYFF